MSLNVKLLLKVKKHILAKPSRLRMGNWVASTKRKAFKHVAYIVGSRYFQFDRWGEGTTNAYGEPFRQRIPDCGTVGCIAGWTCLLSKKKIDNSVEFHARRLLGLNDSEGYRLFRVQKWPAELNSLYKSAKTARQRAKVVGLMIDKVIQEHAGSGQGPVQSTAEATES